MLLLSAAFASVSGCASLLGTIPDSGENKIYIGTRTDADLLVNGCPNASPCLLPRPIAALDLPFSLLMDTVLLVYTVPASAHSH